MQDKGYPHPLYSLDLVNQPADDDEARFVLRSPRGFLRLAAHLRRRGEHRRRLPRRSLGGDLGAAIPLAARGHVLGHRREQHGPGRGGHRHDRARHHAWGARETTHGATLARRRHRAARRSVWLHRLGLRRARRPQLAAEPVPGAGPARIRPPTPRHERRRRGCPWAGRRDHTAPTRRACRSRRAHRPRCWRRDRPARSRRPSPPRAPPSPRSRRVRASRRRSAARCPGRTTCRFAKASPAAGAVSSVTRVNRTGAASELLPLRPGSPIRRFARHAAVRHPATGVSLRSPDRRA